MEISIRCKAHKLIPVGAIENIQGGLKTISDHKMAKLKSSLKQSGFSFPVAVWEHDGHYYSIDGIHRVKALAELKSEGYLTPDKVPAAFIEAKNKKEAKELLLKASSQYAEFSHDEFYLFTKDMDQDFLTDVIDIPSVDIDRVLNMRTEIDGLDEVPAIPKVPTARPGDIYEITHGGCRHRIMCGDSTDKNHIQKLAGTALFDLILTDPPYGVDIEYKNERIRSFKSKKARGKDQAGEIKGDEKDETAVLLNAFLANTREFLSSWNSFYIFGAHNVDGLGLAMETALRDNGYSFRHLIIWNKDRPTFHFNLLDYAYQHEPIFYGWVGRHKFYGKGSCKRTIWTFNQTKDAVSHPTMKPVELLENAIYNSTQAGMNVYDGFAGSGSGLIACIKTGRNFFGMEIDPGYFDVTIERAQNYLQSADVSYKIEVIE